MFPLLLAILAITENKSCNRQRVTLGPQPEIECSENAGNGANTSKFVRKLPPRNADGGTSADARPAASSQHWQKPVQ